MEVALVVGAGLVFLSVLLTPLIDRVGAPILLLFLAVGMLAGEDGPGGIAFDDFELAYDVGGVALAVILFAGGLATPARAFRVAWAPSLLLASLGVVITSGVVGAVAIAGLGMPLFEGLLLGAVVGSTDAAATFLLLQSRGIELGGRTKETILLESGLNDPTAIFLTTVCVTLVDGGAAALSGSPLRIFALQLGLGALSGAAGGLALASLVRRLQLDAGLTSVLALSGALLVFAATQALGGSGFLAAYVAGVLLGRGTGHSPAMAHFHDGLAWLCQIAMFLMLGLLVTPSRLPAELGPAALVTAVLLFLARPAAVALCLAPFGYRRNERLFVAWVGLRGAVPIFLAIIAVVSPGPLAEEFFNVVFVVVIASLLLQGWTIPPLARRLGLLRDGAAQSSE